MRENPKANPGKQPYRENKEGRQPSIFRKPLVFRSQVTDLQVRVSYPGVSKTTM
jgi:hypothetical protein